MIVRKERIILGSQSPRRKELLERMDIDFDIRVADIEEIVPDDLPLGDAAEYLARLKSNAIELFKDEILITADSIVLLDNEILGKPKDNTQAKDFLRKISNKKHLVITGVCLRDSRKIVSFSENTIVHIGKLREEEIDYYLDHYNALDKAGSYGIQDWIGWTKVTEIEGSYPNVMGLPVHRVYDELMNW